MCSRMYIQRPVVTAHGERERGRSQRTYIPEQSVPPASRVGICPLAPYSRLLPIEQKT